MGYKRNKLLKLSFEEAHELHGLEVQIRPAKMKLITEIASLDKSTEDISQLLCEVCQRGEFNDSGNPSAECLGGILESFVGYLHSWNLEDENDQPVPSNMVGVLDQDIELILYLLESWAEATGSVPEALKAKSTAGEQSPVASEAMDLLSQSQTPLLTQN